MLYQIEAEKWWELKKAIEGSAKGVTFSSGLVMVNGSLCAGEDGQATRYSAYCETAKAVSSIDYYQLASGRVIGPFYNTRGSGGLTAPIAKRLRAARAAIERTQWWQDAQADCDKSEPLTTSGRA